MERRGSPGCDPPQTPEPDDTKRPDNGEKSHCCVTEGVMTKLLVRSFDKDDIYGVSRRSGLFPSEPELLFGRKRTRFEQTSLEPVRKILCSLPLGDNPAEAEAAVYSLTLQERAMAFPEDPASAASLESARNLVRDTHYDIVRVISPESRGLVVLARDMLSGGAERAIKFIQATSSPDSHERLQKAVLSHRSLRHPHIVEFDRVFKVPGKIAVVMECAHSGTLSDYLRQEQKLEESLARWFLQQIAVGVEYCNRKGVPCGDLNLDKILLKQVPDLFLPTAKLHDFGYSERHANSVLGSSVDRVAFMAPEVIEWWETVGEDPGRPEYDSGLASVWSCGAILYSLIVGEHAFVDGGADGLDEEARKQSVINNIKALDYSFPDSVQGSCRDFISKCLTKAANRLSFEGMMGHEWLARNAVNETMGNTLEKAKEMTDEILANDVQLMAVVEEKQSRVNVLGVINAHMVEHLQEHQGQG